MGRKVSSDVLSVILSKCKGSFRAVELRKVLIEHAPSKKYRRKSLAKKKPKRNYENDYNQISVRS